MIGLIAKLVVYGVLACVACVVLFGAEPGACGGAVGGVVGATLLSERRKRRALGAA